MMQRILLLFLISLGTCHSSLLNIQEMCCTLGSNYALANRRCSRYTRPITNIAAEDKENCRVIVEICCMKEVHFNQCSKGRSDAEEKLLCQVNADAYGAEQYTQCCQCCRLGRVAAKSGMRCDLTSYGDPCDRTFKECCQAENIRQQNGKGGSHCHAYNPCDHICLDANDTVVCSCLKGYQLNSDGKTCSDIDECQTQSPCTDGTLCINIPGDYKCSYNPECPERSTFDAATKSCLCQSNMYHNTTTRRCECKNGYGFNVVDSVCDDIDECIVQSHNCNNSNQCLNKEGTFECCGVGYAVNHDELQCEDIDECAFADSCPAGLQCSNSPGSFVCRRMQSCGTGYSLNEETQQCDDVDECRLRIDNCGTYTCKNIKGSFRCEIPPRPVHCPPGTIFNQNTQLCESQQRQECRQGMWRRNGICVDINECAERVDTCGRHQVCHNTHGSYYCSNTIDCGPGLWYDVNGSRCRDIDECGASNHTCSRNQICRNIPGSFKCDCKNGFIALASGYCEDIDECHSRHRYCPRNAICLNVPGSFSCECKNGYELIRNGRLCRDIDECSQEGQCEHFCENSQGSYRCSCRNGYKLDHDKRSCKDIDECSGIYKRCSYRCENTPGSFQCSCPHGFRMSADQVSCHDIDECSEIPGICRNYEAICINTRGNHKCPVVMCPSAYTKSAYGAPGNSVRCQRPSICPVQNIECLTSPLSLSYNFMTFPSKIKVPTTLFTLSGRIISSRYFRFNLQLQDASPQQSGVMAIGQQYFHLNSTANSAAIGLLREIPGPQDVELQLTMDMYNSDKHQLIGQAVSKIFIFVT